MAHSESHSYPLNGGARKGPRTCSPCAFRWGRVAENRLLQEGECVTCVGFQGPGNSDAFLLIFKTRFQVQRNSLLRSIRGLFADGGPTTGSRNYFWGAGKKDQHCVLSASGVREGLRQLEAVARSWRRKPTAAFSRINAGPFREGCFQVPKLQSWFPTSF